MAKQDDYVRYTIRLPADLYERVRTAAGDKSVNAEIIIRLEGSLSASDGALQAQASDLAEKIVARVIERVEKIRFEADEEIKVLQEENRALREAAKGEK